MSCPVPQTLLALGDEDSATLVRERPWQVCGPLYLYLECWKAEKEWDKSQVCRKARRQGAIERSQRNFHVGITEKVRRVRGQGG